MKTPLKRIVSKYKGIIPQIAKELNVNKSWVYRVVDQDTSNTTPKTIDKVYDVIFIIKPNELINLKSKDELFIKR